MNNTLNLELDTLDNVEAPLTDMEWGILAGAAGALAFVLVAT